MEAGGDRDGRLVLSSCNATLEHPRVVLGLVLGEAMVVRTSCRQRAGGEKCRRSAAHLSGPVRGLARTSDVARQSIATPTGLQLGRVRGLTFDVADVPEKPPCLNNLQQPYLLRYLPSGVLEISMRRSHPPVQLTRNSVYPFISEALAGDGSTSVGEAWVRVGRVRDLPPIVYHVIRTTHLGLLSGIPRLVAIIAAPLWPRHASYTDPFLSVVERCS